MRRIALGLFCLYSFIIWGQEMMFGDTTRIGLPFSKDPHVIEFGGKYLMYYSIPPSNKSGGDRRWGIGIAVSKDMEHWNHFGEIFPQEVYEKQGICAPCALVRNDTIHLFYQTYGNERKDAICHAWSADGTHFIRNKTNPIFSPTGSWNCGRAIDAEVIFENNKYYLYYATRTLDYSKQIIGVAIASVNTPFDRDCWVEACGDAILIPQYPWEGECIEAPSVIRKDGWLYMFYAGSYNNTPQQIGLARSKDGIKWDKMSNKPFLENGDLGTWNYCESGHPHIFRKSDGKTFLFYQGNNDFGKTWFLSNLQVYWKNSEPYLKQ